jgi:hypothetical protein
MVADKTEILRQVAEVYDWLNQQINDNPRIAGSCNACGKCCDFKSFGHKLFVTPPELIYLAEKLGDKKLKPMQSDRCPYNQESKCMVYEYRFTGCRIFSCRGDADFQSRLSEAVIKRLRKICSELHVDYLYMPLDQALNGQESY